MKAKPHHARRFPGLIPEHVCEVCVQRQEDAILFDGRDTYVVVIGARQPDFCYGHPIVT